jgi:outer membrane protein OmpA-like peptidoglycan-associated protein
MYSPLQQSPEEQRARRAPRPSAIGPDVAGTGLPQYLRSVMEASPDAGVADAGSGPVDAGAALPGGVAGGGALAPAGPDACGTVEEEQRKERFRQRTFSALDFRPSAGYGKFDAYYWPRLSLMAAIVKMKFNYIQADNTPLPPTLVSMVASGQDISRYFWTDAQKREFARDYVQRVSDRWSFSHVFHSTKSCWPFIARPHVTPRVVEDVADAHFNVTVHKSAGPGIDYRSAFGARNPGTPGWRGTGDLYSSDVWENSDFNSVQVARSERQRLERAVAAASVSPVLFLQNSAVIQPPYGARLRTLAAAMLAKSPSDPAIPVVCSGFASAEGGRVHNERLARQRAEAVAGELRGAGVVQPLVVSSRGPVGAPNEAVNRKVEIAPSTTFESSYAGNRYSVGEHEFGHALGLPDEYVNRTTGDLGVKQQAFADLARQAGVAPPDRWGDTTSSQMAAGVDVLPRHYLTIWEALGHLTAPDITRNEWSIG